MQVEGAKLTVDSWTASSQADVVATDLLVSQEQVVHASLGPPQGPHHQHQYSSANSVHVPRGQR